MITRTKTGQALRRPVWIKWVLLSSLAAIIDKRQCCQALFVYLLQYVLIRKQKVPFAMRNMDSKNQVLHAF